VADLSAGAVLADGRAAKGTSILVYFCSPSSIFEGGFFIDGSMGWVEATMKGISFWGRLCLVVVFLLVMLVTVRISYGQVSGSVYDSGSNVETSDSISVP